MSEYAKQLLGRIEAIDNANADNRRRAETYQRMEGELKAVQGTATSPDGVVTVIAGAGGEITQVTFSDQVRGVDPPALSATVMHTIAAARAAAAQQQAEVVRRGLDDTSLLDKVLDSDQKLFGDQRPQDPGPPPAAAAPGVGPAPAGGRRRRRNDDDFFEGFNVLGGRSAP